MAGTGTRRNLRAAEAWAVSAPAYRIDGASVEAARFYAAACDPRRSVVVEACAGAGKTWMLVARIVRALLDGAEPDQILAITFTRKAAAEMRQRLDGLLAELAAPGADDEMRRQALEQRGMDRAAAAGAAGRLGGLQRELLEHGQAVQVRTFHGWFGQLLSQAPLGLLQQLGLAAAPALIEDPSELQSALWRDFHRQLVQQPSLGEAYRTLVGRHRRQGVQRWLEAAWARRGEFEAADAAGTLDASVPPAWQVFPGLAAGVSALEQAASAGFVDRLAALTQVQLERGRQGKKLSAQAGAGLDAAVRAADPATRFERAWQVLFTADGTPRQRLGDDPLLRTVGDELAAMHVRLRQQQAHEDHQGMVSLARCLLACYAQLKRQRALVDMTDLEQVARTLLGDGELAAWTQARLGQRLRHLLIDEFQDTSPVQWHALQGWLAGYAGAGAGAGLSVFIVGDPKQSIYRFRRAEPRVFVAARDHVVRGLGGSWLACDHTRRNSGAVVEAVNTVFSGLAREGVWQGFRPHSTASPEAGAVLRLPLAVPPAAPGPAAAAEPRDVLLEPRDARRPPRGLIEAARVAQAVASLCARGTAPGDVMVLARRRVTLGLVAQALAAQGLAFTVPEAMSLARAAPAQDLLAVLEALVSPAHDLALARALRSPMLDASDDDLLWLSRQARGAGGAEGRSWWRALMEADHPPGGALPRARTLLAGWKELAGRLPPHDLLERIVQSSQARTRIAAMLPARQRAAALQAVDALLAAALEVDQGRFLSPYRLLRALHRHDPGGKWATPADAVRLLTVHGAKGLEAPWVFLADCEPKPRAREPHTLVVDWPVERAAPARVAFLASEAAAPPSLVELLEQEQAARAREELNGLYVAMTRAERALVFSATQPLTRAEGSWWSRVEALASEWVDPLAETAAQGLDPGGAARLGAAGPEVLSLPVLPPAPVGARATQAAAPANDEAGLGRAVHRALEWIGQPGRGLAAEDWPAMAGAAARWAGVEAAAVLRVVHRILTSAACERFFVGAGLRWAGNEVPLADANGLMRLDRLVLLDEPNGPCWWVLDYKLGSRPELRQAARAQLRRYAAAVALAQPGQAVRSAFITGEGRLVSLEHERA